MAATTGTTKTPAPRTGGSAKHKLSSSRSPANSDDPDMAMPDEARKALAVVHSRASKSSANGRTLVSARPLDYTLAPARPLGSIEDAYIAAAADMDNTLPEIISDFEGHMRVSFTHLKVCDILIRELFYPGIGKSCLNAKEKHMLRNTNNHIHSALGAQAMLVNVA